MRGEVNASLGDRSILLLGDAAVIDLIHVTLQLAHKELTGMVSQQ